MEQIEGKTLRLISEDPRMWESTMELQLADGKVTFQSRHPKGIMAEVKLVNTVLAFCDNYNKIFPNLEFARASLSHDFERTVEYIQQLSEEGVLE